MHLRVSPQVLSSHILDAPLVHVARGDMPRGDQVAQPLGGVGVELVVVRAHVAASPRILPSVTASALAPQAMSTQACDWSPRALAIAA